MTKVPLTPVLLVCVVYFSSVARLGLACGTEIEFLYLKLSKSAALKSKEVCLTFAGPVKKCFKIPYLRGGRHSSGNLGPFWTRDEPVEVSFYNSGVPVIAAELDGNDFEMEEDNGGVLELACGYQNKLCFDGKTGCQENYIEYKKNCYGDCARAAKIHLRVKHVNQGDSV